jgi:uncharacterized damage-inducible protein DinB
MKEQLLEAWRIANRMNLLLIDNIDDDAMQKTLSGRGGRLVFQQLVHLVNVRYQWLETIDKDIFLNHKPIDKEAAYDRKILRNAFEESAKAIEEFINKSWEAGGVVKSFKKGLIPFVGYLIAHDSHHRGNIMLTLKQCGLKLTDTLKWGLWEWGK